MTRCWMRRSKPAPTTWYRARAATRSTPRRKPFARSPRRWRRNSAKPRKAALTWKPQNTVAVDDETGEKLLKLMDLLNEHDDVQNVFANFEISDALMAKMGGCAVIATSNGRRAACGDPYSSDRGDNAARSRGVLVPAVAGSTSRRGVDDRAGDVRPVYVSFRALWRYHYAMALHRFAIPSVFSASTPACAAPAGA